MGTTHGDDTGLLTALVADEAPPHLRATAFGLFNFVTGAALLPASMIAGFLWAHIGPFVTFMSGAVFTAVGLPPHDYAPP